MPARQRFLSLLNPRKRPWAAAGIYDRALSGNLHAVVRECHNTPRERASGLETALRSALAGLGGMSPCQQQMRWPFSPEALETLVRLMPDRELPGAVRIKAAEAVLNRGIGLPAQPVDVTVNRMTAVFAESAREISRRAAHRELGRGLQIFEVCRLRHLIDFREAFWIDSTRCSASTLQLVDTPAACALRGW
jgi:hypothetical protein